MSETNELMNAALEMTEESEATSTLSVAELDEMVKRIAEVKAQIEQLEQQAELKKKDYQKLLAAIQPHLESLGRTSYKLNGFGTVYKHVDNAYKMPQLHADKTALFEYIKTKYGESALLGYLSIHHASLNTFVKEEKENGAYMIPGLATPTPVESLRFRKG